MDSVIPRLPPSHYENFIESLAQIVSKLLTDKETETILTSILSFQERIKRLSSQNLKRLNAELDTITGGPEAPPFVCKHEGKTCTQNCTRGFIKAFAVGFSVKYLIGILPSLLTGKLFKTPSLLKRMAGRDTALFALFLSTFLSSYKGILCLMRRLRGTADESSDRLNAFVAGAVAGLSLMIDPDRRRRQSIMMYLLTRSFQFSGGWLLDVWAKSRHARRESEDEAVSISYQRQMNHQTWEDRLAKALERFAGVFVMMLSSSQLIYAFLFEADTLTKSYQSFLLEHAGWKDDVGKMALPISHAVCDTIHRMTDTTDPASFVPFRIPIDTTSRDFVAQHISSDIATVIPKDIRHPYAICAIQHPLDPNCARSKLTLGLGEVRRALKLYVPLNVIMMLVFRYNKMKSDPLTVLKKFLQSCTRSSFFLVMYVVVGFATPCVVRNMSQCERPWHYYLPGAMGGAMVLLEAPGRQLELGLYCFTRAMESWWRTMVKHGRVKNLPYGDVLVFMLSMGTMMTIYQNDKQTIASHYLSAMTRFFGNN